MTSLKKLHTKRLEELKSLYGIGDVMAENMLRNGIAGIKLDINKPMRSQLRNSKIFKHLPDATKADLKYNPSRSIPRKIMIMVDKELKKILKNQKYDIGGSYRRKKPISRDMDLMLFEKSGMSTSELWTKFRDKINENSKILNFKKPFALGEDKASVIVEVKYKETDPKSKVKKNKKIKIKTDVFFTPPDEYLFMLLFVTGSGQFNIRMRAQAKRLGYLLNQKGLFKKVGDKLKPVSIKTEKELFELLHIAWKEPHERIK